MSRETGNGGVDGNYPALICGVNVFRLGEVFGAGTCALAIVNGEYENNRLQV